jgi:hypothetical protein
LFEGLSAANTAAALKTLTPVLRSMFDAMEFASSYQVDPADTSLGLASDRQVLRLARISLSLVFVKVFIG